MDNSLLFEVETRLHFHNQKEAYDLLPFLKDSLKNEVSWKTVMYGLDLFRSDKILRVSHSCHNKLDKVFLGYKDNDTGSFCNIRAEKDEDITAGSHESFILSKISQDKTLIFADNVIQVLQSNGYHPFMSFTGFNLTGCYNGFSLKLMSCSILKYPLMLEIEKAAETAEKALIAEKEIYSLIEEYRLLERVVREEPTTLLYEKEFTK